MMKEVARMPLYTALMMARIALEIALTPSAA